MRHWNPALLTLVVAGLLCGVATPSLAQQKKIDGKKADGAPPAGKLAPPAVPADVVPADGVPADVVPELVPGVPGLLPDAAPPVIPSLEYNYYYPPPGYYAPAPVYMEQYPAAPQTYWYYCAPAGAYYPYVGDCPGGWQRVVPHNNPPPPAG